MEVADLVFPAFAVIVTGWLAGWLGYISRSLADGLVHFAYNVAMPALLFIHRRTGAGAQSPEGGSVLCFALVFLAVRIAWGCDLGQHDPRNDGRAPHTNYVADPAVTSAAAGYWGGACTIGAAAARVSSRVPLRGG
jgi:malonate transporter and related proteins